MTAATMAYLPVQVGGTLLSSGGRAALFLMRQYMRAPLANTGIAALVAMSALASSNAIFGQHHMHPAPLFAPVKASPTLPDVDPVVPAPRPTRLVIKPVAPVTPKLTVASTPMAQPVPSAPIGNADVVAVQQKLAALSLFTGTADGYYGPQTAKAIKKFEELHGLKQRGMLTRELMELIAKAPLAAGDQGAVAVVPQPQAAPAQPLPQVVAPAEPQVAAPEANAQDEVPKAMLMQVPDPVQAAPAAPVVQASLQPLPKPAPLDADLETGSIKAETKVASNKPTLLGRPLPQTPQQALNMAADTAGQAIDTIVSGVQTVTSKPVTKVATAEPYAATTDAKLSVQPDDLAAGPRPGVPLELVEDEPAKPATNLKELSGSTSPDDLGQPFSPTDPTVVAQVQRGLASLGFLHGSADGIAGEATAKAIRNFEVYFNYDVTGRISPELLELLAENGASM